jgi:hypothetical protein
MSAPVANMSPRDRNSFQYSNINSILFGYHQQTPGIPFMTMVKRHLYPNDPLAEVLADRQVMSANNDAAMGGRNMAETLEGATLTPLDVYKFSDSPAGQRVREMFEQAYTGVAHYDEFARRYAVRVRKLVSDAGLDPDSPEVKRALTTGWMQVVDTTEEPPENGGRFISAALLVRNLVAGLYRPSWDSAGESYTTPHEFMHLITGQGFTRHGEMASNIGWLGAFGKDVWPVVANLLTAQTRFFDMQKEDSEGGDLIEGNKRFRGLVLNEIKELLGGDGDDFGRTSQALLDELYQDGGVLRTEKSDGLFEGFGWIDPLFPLEAEDLGWGYRQNKEDNTDGLSLSSGGKSSRVVITRDGYNQRLNRTNEFANQDESKDKDLEELKQEHIKRFGYSYTRVDKDGYDKNPKAIIEIFNDELAYNSLDDLIITIGKGKEGQTKTANTIRKIRKQIEESVKEKDMEFVLEDGPDGFKYYLKKLDMSYIEEENNERLRLIEKYKSEGLTAIEATMRAYEDMKNNERFSYGKRFLKNTNEDSVSDLSLSSGANDKFKKQLALIDEAVSRSSSRGVKTSSYQQKDITKELVDEVEKATLDIESTVKLITEKIDEQLDEAYDGNLPEAQKQARIDELLEELESVSVVQESSRLSYLALDKLKGILSKNERGDSWEYSWPESVHISRNSNGEIIGFAIMAVSATNMALEYQNRWNGLEDNVDGKVLLIDYLVSLHKEKDTGRTILSSILNEAKKNNVSLIQIETTNSSEEYWNKFGFSSPKRNKDWAVNGALPSYSFLNIGTQKETDDK